MIIANFGSLNNSTECERSSSIPPIIDTVTVLCSHSAYKGIH